MVGDGVEVVKEVTVTGPLGRNPCVCDKYEFKADNKLAPVAAFPDSEVLSV